MYDRVFFSNVRYFEIISTYQFEGKMIENKKHQWLFCERERADHGHGFLHSYFASLIFSYEVSSLSDSSTTNYL